MMLKRDWLWDRKVSLPRAKVILKNPDNPRFLHLAGLLFARKNNPREVLKGYVSTVIFLQNWQRIKKRMRQDDWNSPRIEYWQAIYEKLRDKYRKKGINITVKTVGTRHKYRLCKSVGQKLREMRKKKGLTQGGLAKRLKVSQQIISRIENGNENISLITLKNIVNALGATLKLEIF